MTQAESQKLIPEDAVQGTIVIVARPETAKSLQHAISGILADMGYSSMNLDPVLSAQAIVNQVRKARAHAVAVSVESPQDRHLVEQIMVVLRTQGLSLPLLLLGEEVDPAYAQQVALPENGELYRGGVYYCENADEVLQVLKQIILFTPPPVEHEHEHDEESGSSNSCSGCSGCGEGCALSSVTGNEDASKPPSPPFWGYRTELDIPWEAVLELLDKQELLVRWMATVQSSDSPGGWQDFDIALNAMLHQLTWLLKPRVIYGYFPVQSDGKALILYDFENPVLRCEIGRLALPRIGQNDAYNPVGNFATVDSQCIDVLALQVVTFEEVAFDVPAFGFDDASWLSMMQVALLNAMRAWITQRIRLDLSMPAQKGSLVVWEHNTPERSADFKVLFDVLPLRDALDLSLSPSGEMTPPNTSMACFIHSADEFVSI